MEVAELAWTAGMVDADGCITLTLHPSGWRSPRIVVDNTDREIIDELVRLFGGRVIAKTRYAAHHRQCYSWRLHGAEHVRAFLVSIVPFMRCAMKVARARILIDEWAAVTPRNGRYTPALAESKRAVQDRFMALADGRGSRSSATMSAGL